MKRFKFMTFLLAFLCSIIFFSPVYAQKPKAEIFLSKSQGPEYTINTNLKIELKSEFEESYLGEIILQFFVGENPGRTFWLGVSPEGETRLVLENVGSGTYTLCISYLGNQFYAPSETVIESFVIK